VSGAIGPGEFEEFYAATQRALRSYICRVAGSESAADDVLQESYIRLLNAPAVPKSQRKAYLYRVATNLVLDHHRAVSRQRRWWQWWPVPQEAVENSADLAADLGRLFAHLPAKDRALLWLAYVEGAEHREIAEILHVGEKSVKVLLHRARRKMEEILREHGYEAGHD
jgi:RNA polymerase sigma-70 factor (ECF subfamily)